jgi:hypothetical protein
MKFVKNRWLLLFLLQISCTWTFPKCSFLIRPLPTPTRRCCRSISSLCERPPSNSVQFDLDLVAKDPQLIKSHLLARQTSESIISMIDSIEEFRKLRSTLIVERDKARNVRKKLSKEIWVLLSNQKLQEAEQIKVEVETAASMAQEADEKLALIEAEITKVLQILPNLLDDR